jgi:ABC-2 type transport system permease protein
MTRLLAVLLRSFARDRATLVFSLAAPLAFFALAGSFYRHLESEHGVVIHVTVDDQSETDDGRLLADALRESATPPLSVDDAAGARPTVAAIRINAGFRRDGGTVRIENQVPFPGGKDLLRQFVDKAWSVAFGQRTAHRVEMIDRPGLLVRDAASGVSVVFMMFAVSSLVARGLADDAAGFGLRLRALGMSALAVVTARCTAMAMIGLSQVIVTLALAAIAFGVVPVRPIAVLVVSAIGALAVAAFYCLLASACGRRSRFVAVAPVVTLVLAGLSGALIPRIVLPEAVARAGALLFPSWIIDATRSAMEGELDVARLVGLAGVSAGALVLAAVLVRRGAAA